MRERDVGDNKTVITQFGLGIAIGLYWAKMLSFIAFIFIITGCFNDIGKRNIVYIENINFETFGFVSYNINLVNSFNDNNPSLVKSKTIDQINRNINNPVANFILSKIYTTEENYNKALETLKLSVIYGGIPYNSILYDKILSKLVERNGERSFSIQYDEWYSIFEANLIRYQSIENGISAYVDADNRFIIYSSSYQEIANAMLKDAADLKRYCSIWFDYVGNEYLRILLVTEDDQAELLGMKGVGGYWNLLNIIMVSNYAGTEMFKHELIHAFHGSHQFKLRQNHSLFVSEGLADLLSSIDTCSNKVNIQVDDVIKAKVASTTLEDLLNIISNNSNNLIACLEEDILVYYSMVRLVFQYLYNHAKFDMFYDEYCKNHAIERSGRLALERTMNCNLKEFLDEWKKWVMSLKNQ